MLFSDILLMTRRNGRIFTCTEQPLLLENLIISDINCTERMSEWWGEWSGGVVGGGALKGLVEQDL